MNELRSFIHWARPHPIKRGHRCHRPITEVGEKESMSQELCQISPHRVSHSISGLIVRWKSFDPARYWSFVNLPSSHETFCSIAPVWLHLGRIAIRETGTWVHPSETQHSSILKVSRVLLGAACFPIRFVVRILKAVQRNEHLYLNSVCGLFPTLLPILPSDKSTEALCLVPLSEDQRLVRFPLGKVIAALRRAMFRGCLHGRMSFVWES